MKPARWMGTALVLLTLGFSAAQGASPEVDARLKSLQFALEQAERAQQSVNTQFQMLREIRRAQVEQRDIAVPDAGVASPPRNYDDLVRARAEDEQRARQNVEELNRLYARFSEIEQEKAQLRDQIRRLMETP